MSGVPKKNFQRLFAPFEREMNEAYQVFKKEARRIMEKRKERVPVVVACQFSLVSVACLKGGPLRDRLKREPMFCVSPNGHLSSTYWLEIWDKNGKYEKLAAGTNLGRSAGQRTRFRIFELVEILERLARGEYAREELTIVDGVLYIGREKAGV